MTTWAADAFGNDYALDWAQDLQETSSLEPLESSFDYVIDNGMGCAADVEAPLAAEALAAADVLARLLGNPDVDADGPAGVDAWVAQRLQKATPRFQVQLAQLADKARQAIGIVLAPASELNQLWQESEHYQQWLDEVAALQSRLPHPAQ
jgi:hypothetical protein